MSAMYSIAGAAADSVETDLVDGVDARSRHRRGRPVAVARGQRPDRSIGATRPPIRTSRWYRAPTAKSPGAESAGSHRRPGPRLGVGEIADERERVVDRQNGVDPFMQRVMDASRARGSSLGMDIDPRALIDGGLELTVVGSFSRIGHAVRRRLYAWSDPRPDALDGKTVLITGPTSGLGRAAAEAVAALGARVVLVGRTRSRLDGAPLHAHRRTRRRPIPHRGRGYGVARLCRRRGRACRNDGGVASTSWSTTPARSFLTVARPATGSKRRSPRWSSVHSRWLSGLLPSCGGPGDRGSSPYVRRHICPAPRSRRSAISHRDVLGDAALRAGEARPGRPRARVGSPARASEHERRRDQRHAPGLGRYARSWPGLCRVSRG